jgi:hypothetical protein
VIACGGADRDAERGGIDARSIVVFERLQRRFLFRRAPAVDTIDGRRRLSWTAA